MFIIWERDYHLTFSKFDSNTFFNFNWRIITLQYYDGFAIHQHELAIGTHVSPSSLSPLPSPSPLHPCGCHGTPALGALRDRLNSHQLSILNKIMYMFECYFLKSSQPLLPLSSKVCSLYLCVCTGQQRRL